jgi:hypothetical protein
MSPVPTVVAPPTPPTHTPLHLPPTQPAARLAPQAIAPAYQYPLCVCTGDSYQVGATPSFVELPRDHCDRMRAFKDADAPLSLCPPEKDPKWRFFWRVGSRPEVRSCAHSALC